MGMPKLKTDNGPAYTSKSFAPFCAQFPLKHGTGIPYNPQEQPIIERSNQSQKLTAGNLTYSSPHIRSHSLFVLNFLNRNNEGLSAVQRHWNPQVQTFLWYAGRMSSPRNGKGQTVCFPPGGGLFMFSQRLPSHQSGFRTLLPDPALKLIAKQRRKSPIYPPGLTRLPCH